MQTVVDGLIVTPERLLFQEAVIQRVAPARLLERVIRPCCILASPFFFLIMQLCNSRLLFRDRLLKLIEPGLGLCKLLFVPK